MDGLLISLAGWLMIVVIGAIGALAVAKVRVYRSEHLLQLANACASVANKDRRANLENELCISLENALDSSRISFVDYYKNVSQPGRILYIIGSSLLLLSIFIVLIQSLFVWILPQMESLAADTIIAAQYNLRDVIEDVSLNLVVIITASLVSISSIVWLFTYIGERLPVVYRIAFKNEKVAEPKRKKLHHILLTTIGFTLPITLLTYIVYLIHCDASLDIIKVEDLIKDDNWARTDDEATRKLKGAKLALHYSDICSSPPSDEERKVGNILSELDREYVKKLVKMSRNQCFEEAFPYERHDQALEEFLRSQL